MPRAGFREFKTDVIREIGFDSAKSQNIALQIALTHPSEYFAMRQTLLEGVVKDNIEMIYNTVWNALTIGTNKDNNAILPAASFTNSKELIIKTGTPETGTVARYMPMFPEHEVNAIAMSVARGFKDLMEQQLVNVILPQDLHQTALQKTAVRTVANLSGAGGGKAPEATATGGASS
jgi:hypothetical protein